MKNALNIAAKLVRAYYEACEAVVNVVCTAETTTQVVELVQEAVEAFKSSDFPGTIAEINSRSMKKGEEIEAWSKDLKKRINGVLKAPKLEVC